MKSSAAEKCLLYIIDGFVGSSSPSWSDIAFGLMTKQTRLIQIYNSRKRLIQVGLWQVLLSLRPAQGSKALIQESKSALIRRIHLKAFPICGIIGQS